MRPQRRHIIKISLTALAIVSATTLVISIVLLVNNIRLLGMAEHWMLLGSLLVLLLLAGYWLWRQCHDVGWPVRILSDMLWGCALAIFILSAIAVIHFSDKQICRSGAYIVYHEQPFLINIDPLPMTLYHRSGLRETPLFSIDCEMQEPVSAALQVDEDNDLVTLETEWQFDGQRWSSQKSYTLSTGQPIEQTEQ